MLLQLSHFFLPFVLLRPAPPSHQHSPTLVLHGHSPMSMGRTNKIFGFSVSHSVLTLPLSILYLPFMLLISCTFSSLPSLTDNLHVISISVILFLFQLFA